jgi:hypothetical protein
LLLEQGGKKPTNLAVAHEELICAHGSADPARNASVLSISPSSYTAGHGLAVRRASFAEKMTRVSLVDTSPAPANLAYLRTDQQRRHGEVGAKNRAFPYF